MVDNPAQCLNCGHPHHADNCSGTFTEKLLGFLRNLGEVAERILPCGCRKCKCASCLAGEDLQGRG